MMNTVAAFRYKKKPSVRLKWEGEKKKRVATLAQRRSRKTKKTMLEKKWTVLAWAVSFAFFLTNCKVVQRSGKKNASELSLYLLEMSRRELRR